MWNIPYFATQIQMNIVHPNNSKGGCYLIAEEIPKMVTTDKEVEYEYEDKWQQQGTCPG